MVVDEVSVVIIHEAPTFWNQVPMFDARLAIHSHRKTLWRSGLQGEQGGGAAGLVGGFCGTSFLSRLDRAEGKHIASPRLDRDNSAKPV
jgi:hypothetical protein